MVRLSGKTCVVTGAARGIGRTIAEAFVAGGAVVIATDKDEAAGASMALDAGCRFLRLDVSDETDWEALALGVPSVDVVVNNAGVTGFEHGPVSHDPENATLEAWRAVHAVNLDGTFLGCRYAIRAMKQKAAGSIINISSRSGLVGIPMAAAYASSKAAIRNHTKTVALYCAQNGWNIRCNSIHPAAILTPMWEPMLGSGEDRDARMAMLVRDTPLKRFGRPKEVAALAVLLASDEAPYVTGSEFNIDGGLLAGSAASRPSYRVSSSNSLTASIHLMTHIGSSSRLLAHERRREAVIAHPSDRVVSLEESLMKIGAIVQHFSITVGIMLFLFLALGLGAAFLNEHRNLHEPSEVKIGPETFLIGAGYTKVGHDMARGQRIDGLLFEAILPDLKPIAFESRAQRNNWNFDRDHTLTVLLSYKGPSYAEDDITNLYMARGASLSDSERLPGYRRPLIVVNNSDLYIRQDSRTEPAFVMCQRKFPGNPLGRNACSTIDAIDPVHYPRGQDGRYRLTMKYFVPRDELKNIRDIDRKLRGLVMGWELAGKN